MIGKSWRIIFYYRAAKRFLHTNTVRNRAGAAAGGDPYENRTRDAAVRGRSLNRLTNGPIVFFASLESHWKNAVRGKAPPPPSGIAFF